MWFLITAIPAGVAALSSLLSLSGASKFATSAFGLDSWQRMRGYKRGEGWATPRHEVIITPGYSNLEDAIGVVLSRLSSLDKEGFAPFINKRYEFTESEAEFVRSMLGLVNDTYAEFANAAAMEELSIEEMEYYISKIRLGLEPVKSYLSSFPIRRIHKITVQ